MSANVQLNIPYSSVEDHIQCSICLSVIRGAVLTPCGHRYCTKCITEWVDRKHSCPCCNSNVMETQFYFDVQFDSLVDDILAQRDNAEQAYFDNMLSQAVSGASGDASHSPFEEILKKHMMSSLMSHQRYFDKLRDEYQRKIGLLDAGMTAGILKDELREVQNIDTLKEMLHTSLEESEKLAADAFDRYLTDNVPSLEVLPVTVTVYLVDKNIRIPDVIIKPSDSLSVIKPYIEAAMSERCDEIMNWKDEEGVRLLFGPLNKNNKYKPEDLSSHSNKEDVFPLTWECRPIFQYNMRPGSEIVLHDVFKCQSDIPQRCFVDVFNEIGTHAVDYFSCTQCNIKWICKSCVKCHAGHSVSPFVMNHTPTWACCYCRKKKLCKI